MASANPHSLVSWANLLIEYAEWMEPAPAGVAEHLPGHNSTYKRAFLLEYGERLEAMLEAESILQWDLRAKGHQLYLEAAAKTYHQNFSAPFSWFFCGWMLAGYLRPPVRGLGHHYDVCCMPPARRSSRSSGFVVSLANCVAMDGRGV